MGKLIGTRAVGLTRRAVLEAAGILEADDGTPTAFSFVDQTDVVASATITSAPITVAGINTPVAITVSGGTYNKNGGSFTSTAGTVVNGDVVRARHTASASDATAVNTVVTIGGVSDTFTSTTAAAEGPEELAFADFTGAGTYRVAGVSATVSDLFVQDVAADWGSFNSATHITASGLTGSGDPVIASALRTTLLADGFTIVGVITPNPTTSNSLQIDAYDNGDYSQEWKAVVAFMNDEEAETVHSVKAVTTTVSGSTGVVGTADIKFAATIVPGERVSLSVNGAAIITDTSGATSIADTIGIGTPAGGFVKTLIFYPPQDDADLPALSALD